MSGHHTHIRSAYFNNCYLRLDGRGVTRFSGDGGGTANCQFGIGPYETFSEVIHADQSRSYRSLAFDNVCVRMDPRGATTPKDEGSGLVNGQFGDGPFERFKLLENVDKTWSLMSTTAPNVFLRMDGRGVDDARDGGGGRVNCQYIPSGQPGPFEKFAFEHCIDAAEAEAQLREIAALFPDEKARIEQNDQKIVRRCCPPYAQEQPVPSSVRFERPMVPAPRGTVFSPCQNASIDVGLNAIGLVFGLFGLRVSSTMRTRILGSLGRRVGVLVDSVQSFYTRWVGGALEKAKAFYELVKDLWTHLNLREIMLDALTGWAWWEWILLAVRIGAEVAAWIASDGALLLVKIVLIVLDAVDLGKSIVKCQDACAVRA